MRSKRRFIISLADYPSRNPSTDFVEEASFHAKWPGSCRASPAAAVLVIDELPFLVRAAPELPSLLQKLVDRTSRSLRYVVLLGSSQRMMQGLVLDASAPLYGRAREILRLEPLGAGWIRPAFGLRDPVHAVEHFPVWGGMPRYWELARDNADSRTALESLVVDPLGVLHHCRITRAAQDRDEPRVRDRWP